MPDRIDRRIEGNSSLLITVLVLIALAAAAGFYVFGRMAPEQPSPVEDQPGITSGPAHAEERLQITLSVPGDDGMLSRKTISLSPRIDAQTQAKEALIAALADERVVQTPVLNRLKLRAFFLDESGTAYVDLGPAAGGISASAGEELLAAYALVNTLTRNFKGIRRVRFLVDGKEARTLAGHIDLSQTFTRRMDLDER